MEENDILQRYEIYSASLKRSCAELDVVRDGAVVGFFEPRPAVREWRPLGGAAIALSLSICVLGTISPALGIVAASVCLFGSWRLLRGIAENAARPRLPVFAIDTVHGTIEVPGPDPVAIQLSNVASFVDWSERCGDGGAYELFLVTNAGEYVTLYACGYGSEECARLLGFLCARPAARHEFARPGHPLTYAGGPDALLVPVEAPAIGARELLHTVCPAVEREDLLRSSDSPEHAAIS